MFSSSSLKPGFIWGQQTAERPTGVGATTAGEPAATGSASGYLRWSRGSSGASVPWACAHWQPGIGVFWASVHCPFPPHPPTRTGRSHLRVAPSPPACGPRGWNCCHCETGAITGPSGLSGRSELFPRLGGFRPLGLPLVPAAYKPGAGTLGVCQLCQLV